MNAVEAVGLGLAGFAAGGINAVAGGGTLVSFPALLAAGYPGVTANVTNTVAIWPGTVGGSLAYLPELRDQRMRILVLGATSVVGAILGSIILLVSPEALFDDVAPWLILFACLMLALQTRLGRWVQGRQVAARRGDLGVGLVVAQLVAAIYGAYFGAGLGIVMLAFLGIFLPDALQRVNALKGMLALIINGVAAVAFGVFGPVVWSVALLMAVTSWFGGFLGVRVARRLSATVLRTVVLIFGVTVALTMILE